MREEGKPIGFGICPFCGENRSFYEREYNGAKTLYRELSYCAKCDLIFEHKWEEVK